MVSSGDGLILYAIALPIGSISFGRIVPKIKVVRLMNINVMFKGNSPWPFKYDVRNGAPLPWHLRLLELHPRG